MSTQEDGGSLSRHSLSAGGAGLPNEVLSAAIYNRRLLGKPKAKPVTKPKAVTRPKTVTKLKTVTKPKAVTKPSYNRPYLG